MLEDGKVRSEGCVCEPCSDISPNWKDIRSIADVLVIGAILFERRN